MALTDLAIRSAKPRLKPFKLYDRDGLFLLVTPAGSKLWRWRYSVDGTEKLMTLGKYPEILLAQARDRHFEGRRRLALGGDPMAERKANMESKQEAAKAKLRERDSTFEKIASAWWSWWSVGKSTRHADSVWRRLKADVFPAFGHVHIDAVSAADIRKMMLKIEARGVYDIAKRAHESSGQIFRFAIARGLALRNPAAEFKPRDILVQVHSENFARVDEADLPELLVKIDEYRGDATTRLGLKLLSYTFVRTSELINAPWSEINFEKAVWVIPAERMKMRTPHVVPLSSQSIEVLRALKLLAGNSRLVFPGANNRQVPISNNTLLYALYRLGYRGRMTGHGFRGIASTILHENDFEDAHIDLQLAHMKRNKVAAAYDHARYLKQRTALMQWWANYLDTQLKFGRGALAA